MPCLFTMIIKVNNTTFYTNITDLGLVDKCKQFYQEGCSSYAITFDVEPEYVICEQKERGFEAKILKGINDSLKFVPEKYKNLTSEKLIKKGINLVELI